MNGSGAWGKIAMINTATAAPNVVPITWPKLRASTMPPSGWLMMTTAMIDHLGWSRSNKNARYRVNNPAAMVRKANNSTPGPGLSIALKYCSSACMGKPVGLSPASVVICAAPRQESLPRRYSGLLVGPLAAQRESNACTVSCCFLHRKFNI
ncbi:hypothetical protein D3C84_873910 [compost metagenome]